MAKTKNSGPRARGGVWALIAPAMISCAIAALAPSAGAAEVANLPTVTDFPPMESGNAPGASPQAIATAKSLGRGVNFGNMLDAPIEGAWGIRFQDEYVDKAVEAGFNSVRLPVRWSNHAAVTADATLDEVFAKRVDYVVDALLKRNLVVVLNMHHYRQLDGDKLDSGERAVDPNVLKVRFLSLWKQIALRYRDKPGQLVFELYNEPHGSQQYSWSELAARALGVVRQSNPTRAVVIGPTFWNNANALSSLVLPNDANLIVTVHNYDPFQFTHQGAEWADGSKEWLGTTCCTTSQRSQLTAPLETADAWAKQNRYPIFLGEFGAYSKAPMPSRAAYTRAMRDEAEKRDMSWSYWEFASGFGVYDPLLRNWRAPLKDALLGP